MVDLKEHCIKRNIVKRGGESGSLETLLEKSTGLYLPKDEQYRKSDDWECTVLSEGHLNYAAMDVYASRIIFQRTSELAPITGVEFTTPPGTRVALLAQEGGSPIAYGTIADPQPTVFGRLRVKTPTRSRLLINISTVIVPSAVMILHQPPRREAGRTKANALTLSQLQDAAGLNPLQVVSPNSLLEFDCRGNENVVEVSAYSET